MNKEQIIKKYQDLAHKKAFKQNPYDRDASLISFYYVEELIEDIVNKLYPKEETSEIQDVAKLRLKAFKKSLTPDHHWMIWKRAFTEGYFANKSENGTITREKEDYILLPRELTAENGAKALLIGEFFETIDISESCDCDSWESCQMGVEKMIVSWQTIKDIHRTIVNHFESK